MDNLKNRIAGSLIGGAIGDALGYQIEFKRNVKNKEIISFNNGTGIISDDTQMTLFTANALLFRETRACMRGIALLPVDAIYESYLDWLDTQNHTDNHHSISWIKNIKELNESRAPGNTCISALSSGIKGTIKQPINNSKGCGGIMRVAPIGLYMKKPELAGKFAAEASALTHGHPLGIIPSYVFSTLIWYLTNTDLTIREALDKSIKQYEEKFDIFDKENKNYFIELVNKAIKLSEEDKIDIDAIKELGEGWVAEETFAIAIYSCLKYSNNFKDAIVCSINHDGDSDSTGAVAGNIMGSYLGYEKIPLEYKNNIELRDEILELASDLSIDIPIVEYSDNNDEYWLSKYVYCKRDESLKEKQLNGNKLEKKIKKNIEEIIGNNDPYLNTLVYAIIEKITYLPSNITTTIADLIKYNPNETFVEPLKQGKIYNAFIKVCQHLSINIEETHDSFGGLAFYYQFKKVNNDRL